MSDTEKDDPMVYTELEINAEPGGGWMNEDLMSSSEDEQSPARKKDTREEILPPPSTPSTSGTANPTITVTLPPLRRGSKRKAEEILEPSSVLNRLTQASNKLGVDMDVLEEGFRSSFNLQRSQPLIASKAKIDVHLRTVDYYYHYFKINQAERLLSEIPRMEQTVESMKRTQEATTESIKIAVQAMENQAARPSPSTPATPVNRSESEWVSEVKGHVIRYQKDTTKAPLCNGILKSGKISANVESLRQRHPTDSPMMIARRMLTIQQYRDRQE